MSVTYTDKPWSILSRHQQVREPIDSTLQEETIRLNAKGVTKAEIARQTLVGEATVYRILAKARKT